MREPILTPMADEGVRPPSERKAQRDLGLAGRGERQRECGDVSEGGASDPMDPMSESGTDI